MYCTNRFARNSAAARWNHAREGHRGQCSLDLGINGAWNDRLRVESAGCQAEVTPDDGRYARIWRHG